MSAASRKRQLLALAAAGGSAAVKAAGPSLWPDSVRHPSGARYVRRGAPSPSRFNPSLVLGYYYGPGERCVALSLEAAQSEHPFGA